MSDYVQQHHNSTQFKGDDSWVILSEIEQSIKKKIEIIGRPLKGWDIQINYGIKTGFNDAFIISTEKRNEILGNCTTEEERSRTADIIRPILRGRDIQRYSYTWANLWLIATFPSKGYCIDDYPTLRDYLLSFDIRRLEQTGSRYKSGDNEFKARKKTNNKWYETQDSINYWEVFFQPKIIYPNMTKFLPFVYDDGGYLTNQKCFIITGTHVEYLTCFFNSSLFKYCFRDSFPELLGGTRELSKIFLEKIPVLPISDKQNEDFRLLVKQIQQNPMDMNLLRRIDSEIFSLYELTPQEINVIGFVDIRS